MYEYIGLFIPLSSDRNTFIKRTGGNKTSTYYLLLLFLRTSPPNNVFAYRHVLPSIIIVKSYNKSLLFGQPLTTKRARGLKIGTKKYFRRRDMFVVIHAASTFSPGYAVRFAEAFRRYHRSYAVPKRGSKIRNDTQQYRRAFVRTHRRQR